MADAVLSASAVQTAPAGYTVAENQEIVVKTVRATVDGSGAGVSFLATLQLVSPGGTIIWEAPTDLSIAAGASANVTWFPKLGLTAAGVPGSILQAYAGTFAASDFSWTGPAFTLLNTGFPANSTFTKLSPTSALLIVCNGDFTPAPPTDYLTMALLIDGAIEENIATHIASASAFASVAWSKIRGLGNTSNPPLSAGAHTLAVAVSSASGAGTKVFRGSTSADLQIMEFEP